MKVSDQINIGSNWITSGNSITSICYQNRNFILNLMQSTICQYEKNWLSYKVFCVCHLYMARYIFYFFIFAMCMFLYATGITFLCWFQHNFFLKITPKLTEIWHILTSIIWLGNVDFLYFWNVSIYHWNQNFTLNSTWSTVCQSK